MIAPPSISEISYISKEHGSGQFAQAYALFNVAFSGGFLLGPIWGGFLSERAGWNGMVTSLAALALFSVLPIFFFTGGPIRWRIENKGKDPTGNRSPEIWGVEGCVQCREYAMAQEARHHRKVPDWRLVDKTNYLSARFHRSDRSRDFNIDV
jgi:MFS family permease